MSSPKKNTQAGGSILAVAILIGAIGGTLAGQPSIGFLVGVAVGVIALVLLWLKDRR